MEMNEINKELLADLIKLNAVKRFGNAERNTLVICKKMATHRKMEKRFCKYQHPRKSRKSAVRVLKMVRLQM